MVYVKKIVVISVFDSVVAAAVSFIIITILIVECYVQFIIIVICVLKHEYKKIKNSWYRKYQDFITEKQNKDTPTYLLQIYFIFYLLSNFILSYSRNSNRIILIEKKNIAKLKNIIGEQFEEHDIVFSDFRKNSVMNIVYSCNIWCFECREKNSHKVYKYLLHLYVLVVMLINADIKLNID